jgi:hypothetical protein
MRFTSGGRSAICSLIASIFATSPTSRRQSVSTSQPPPETFCVPQQRAS